MKLDLMAKDLPTPAEYAGATSVGESRATSRRADLMRRRANAYADALAQAMAHNRALEKNLEAAQEKAVELAVECRSLKARLRKLEHYALAGTQGAAVSSGR